MIKYRYLLITTMMLSGCYNATPRGANEAFSIEQIQTNNYSSFFDHGPFLIFNIKFNIPGTYLVQQHETYKHIYKIIISNNNSQTNWPGGNVISLINLNNTSAHNIEGYLKTICIGQTKIKAGDRYELTLIKEEKRMKVMKLHHNCTTEGGYYSASKSIEYIISYSNNDFIARIDEEADAEDMQNFEELMMNVELAD